MATTRRPTAPTADALQALLTASLAFAPEYQDGLSSHLPMALQALHALGASDARLTEFFDHYRTRLVDATPLDPARAPNPELGRIEHFGLWQSRFEQRLRESDADAVLRAALRMLVPGVAGAAFHGVIRVAHAVRAGHQRELAAALAYWAASYQAVPATVATSLGVDAWIAQLTALARQHASTRPDRSLISQSIADWATVPGFDAIAGALDPAELRPLGRVAARLYADTRNFTVLHIVTATTAVGWLQPWIDVGAERALVPAIAAALLASGALPNAAAPTTLRETARDAAPEWDALIAAAINQHDDHVIKLVEACSTLNRRDPNPVWLRAATRAITPMR